MSWMGMELCAGIVTLVLDEPVYIPRYRTLLCRLQMISFVSYYRRAVLARYRTVLSVAR